VSDYGFDFSLICCVLLNAVVFGSAWWFATRRMTASRSQALLDAALLGYAVQYAAVGLPGILGQLRPMTIAITALLCSAMLVLVARRRSVKTHPTEDWFFPAVVGVFVAAFLFAFVQSQASLPLISNDALTYHFPAAVQWLQHRRIDLYQTWFFNPANTYSPLAGSMFIVWLIAPFGNDVLARFVEVPALLCVGVAMYRLTRQLGVRAPGAALTTAAAVLCRPMFLQSMMAKDDLFLAFFFIAILVALAPDRRGEKFGMARIGVALGLLLATKYTAFLAAPILLLAIFNSPGRKAGDRPAKGTFRKAITALMASLFHTSREIPPITGISWVVRSNVTRASSPCSERSNSEKGAFSNSSNGSHGPEARVTMKELPGVTCVEQRGVAAWAVGSVAALSIAILFAGPWYLRNWLATGNPIFPLDVSVFGIHLFHGLFTTSASDGLRPLSTAVSVVVGGSYGLPTPVAIVLGIGWIAAGALGFRSLKHDPLLRACVIGPAVGLAIFVWKSPFPEVRFVVPEFLLLFAATGFAFDRIVRRGIPVLILFPIVSLATIFVPHLWLLAAPLAVAAVIVAVIAALVFRLNRRLVLATGSVLAVALVGYVYVEWTAYCRAYQATLHVPGSGYDQNYAEEEQLWRFVDGHVPADATVAYTNLYMTYPLYGLDLHRHLFYAPTRRGVRTIADLPWLGARLSGEKLVPAAVQATTTSPDRNAWLENLKASDAKFLVIGHGDTPEAALAKENPRQFKLIYDGPGGQVYAFN
jgi:hypothetical protein